MSDPAYNLRNGTRISSDTRNRKIPGADVHNEMLQGVIPLTIQNHRNVGFAQPWIAYAVVRDDVLAGTCAFKSASIGGRAAEARGYAPQRRESCVVMVDMTKQKLMDELVTRYENTAFSGKGAAASGVTYNAKNKCFGLAFDDAESEDLPANFVADHPNGGDEFSDNIKKWIKG